MAICALGYLGVRSKQKDEWSRFAANLLGMQQVDKGGNTVAFRMDDHKQRFVVIDEAGESLAFIGWEVEHKDDLSMFAEKLACAGHAVESGSRALCDQRCVAELIYFDDPDGNRIELFTKPMLSTEPFIPGRPIAGFKTGPVGMGHAVLHVNDAQSLVPFYRDVLGFSLSDFGLAPVPLYFFHVNERHHSFAIVGSGRSGFHHFMVEYQNLDDVGQGYDLAQLEHGRVAYTLGRHTNDYMTSFYANTPSGFSSFWGHERLHLPPGARARFRDMRLKLAQAGERTPAVADCPWLFNELWRE